MVRKYQTKPQTVDAWQRSVAPDNVPVWVPQYIDIEQGRSGWNFLLKPGTTTSRKKGTSYERDNDERRIKMECTDWLVVDGDGAYLYDDRTFKERFEAIQPPPSGPDDF